MPRDASKGGGFGFPRNEDNVSILLVGNYARDADALRRELAFITGLAYTAWYCSDLEEALVFLARRERPVALIFIDLSLFNGSLPKERFLHLRQQYPYTPIIALADQTSEHLTRYVMDNGATESISRSQIRGEQNRLRFVLESVYGRSKTRIKDHHCPAALQAANDAHEPLPSDVSAAPPAFPEAVNIRLLLDGGNPLLTQAPQGEDPFALRGAGAGNTRPRLQLSHSGREALDGSDLLLRQIREKDAIILNIREENAKLREDLRQSGLDHLKGDAILKYAQEKSAIELKTARNEIKELHKDLLQAKDGLPVNPPTKE